MSLKNLNQRLFSQVNKFYIGSFLKNQTYFTPIFILLLQFHNLDFQQIFWVFTIGSIFSFVLEIPTGVIADLWGKRKSIIISKFGVLISFLIFAFAHSFWVFVIAQVVYEIGNSFRTGTETAYIYDYLEQNKDKKGIPTYTEVKGKQKFYARIGESIATAIGGFLASIFGYNAVFLFAAIPTLANLIITITWDKIKEYESKKVSFKSSILFAKRAIINLWSDWPTIRLTVNIALFAAVVASVDKFIQPYMINAGFKVQYFGLVYALALGIIAFLVRYSYILETKFGKVNMINWLTAISIIPLVIIGFKYISIAGAALLFFVIFTENIRSPIANNQFHSRVKSVERATFGSILNQSKELAKIILLPIIGFFASAFSLYTAVLILAGLVLLNVVFFYVRKGDVVDESIS